MNDVSGLGAATDPDNMIGSLFADRYRLRTLVADGAYTLIFEAADETNGRLVTLKIVRPTVGVVADFRERFDAVMSRIASIAHPNVAAVYDWGEAEWVGARTAYVVIEQLAGGSLRDLFDRGRRLSPSQALMVGLEACRALDHVHRRGMLHTELTPSKMVFGGDRRLRIVDFGFAGLLGEAMWAEPATVPTHVARYSAPEQALSMELTDRVDIYALALVLVEAVAGEVPFAADSTVSTLSARVGRLMPVSADLGPLAAVIERAGRPEPEERATAAELGQMLMAAASKLPRPEPLPLLSSSLFDVPPEQLRSPDDPTGGVMRPDDGPSSAADTPEPTGPPTEPEGEPIVVVPLDADLEAPSSDEHGEPPVVESAEPDDHAEPPVVESPDDDQATDELPRGLAGSAEAAEASPGADDLDAALARAGIDPATLSDPDGAPGAAAAAAVAGAALAPPSLDDRVDPAGPPVAADASEGDDDPAPPAGPAGTLTILDEPASPAGAGSADVPVADDALDDPDLDELELDDDGGSPTGDGRRFPWKLVVPLLILGSLAGLGYLAYTLFVTPSYEVPDLTGTPAAEALAEVDDFGWDLAVDRERNDDERREGYVIRTVPGAGEDVAEGEPFLVVVSDGPTFRPLPELDGRSFADAQTELARLELEVDVLEQYDEEVPPGDVVSWTVPSDPSLQAGSMVLPGLEVEVIASLGPQPRIVPDVIGGGLDRALSAIQDLRLVPVQGEPQFSDEVPAGEVISQSPEPGTEVPRDSEVSFVLSKGPDVVELPDVSSLSFDEAVETLADAGLVGVLSFGSTDGEFVSANVDGQLAEPGLVLRRGTQVDLVYL